MTRHWSSVRIQREQLHRDCISADEVSSSLQVDGKECRLQVPLNSRLWLAGLMGFASGLPIMLTVSVLQAWLTSESVDLTTIGFIGLIALPYSTKFLWAPFLDRFDPLKIGRRRSWLIMSQCAVAGSILLLGLQDPEREIAGIAITALLVTIFSATQDIVIDAYRRESLTSAEQGAGATMAIYGYRGGTLLASAGGLVLADHIGFRGVYLTMAGIMFLMLVISFRAPEPDGHPERPRSLKQAFVEPFHEFLSRNNGNGSPLAILLFLVLFNMGAQFASFMWVPFLVSLGFSNSTIGTVGAIAGIGPYLLGVLLGGTLQSRWGIYRVLVLTTVLLGITIAASIVLAVAGSNAALLTGVASLQSLSTGVSSAVTLAYVAKLTSPKYTATQFAVFTAFVGLPRTTLTALAGWAASELGWTWYFAVCALLSVPAWYLLVMKENLFSVDPREAIMRR